MRVRASSRQLACEGASIDTSHDPTHGLVRASPAREIARGGASCSSLAYHFLSSVVCCALVCSLGTLECWGRRQGGRGLGLCVRLLRVCGSPLAVCLVSLFVSVCRSCVPSSSVQRPPIPRWCPVRAWLFFTFLPTYLEVLEVDILWPRWVARIGVTRSTQACFLAADRQCTELPLLRLPRLVPEVVGCDPFVPRDLARVGWRDCDL